MDVTVIGGGLAGCEAAWQAAQRGARVRLYEMRPHKMTPAHTTGHLAELVCSNSLGAIQTDRAAGLLKDEMRKLGSLILECAVGAAVPAGGALAVDRDVFAQAVTRRIEGHPNIEIVREEVTRIPAGITVVASGPLTSDALAADIAGRVGGDYLYFWDAVAPIVTLESIDFDIAFRASRYGRHSVASAPDAAEGEQDEGDYINCPMNESEYHAFVDALVSAESATLREFELSGGHFFEGCLPIEVMARRGRDALAFGPMRPVGIRDPRRDSGTHPRPHAVVQLRQDNLAGTLYNLVGFQTNLKFPEQDRVLRMIPGLHNAEFVRYGQMHRNTFINSPLALELSLRVKDEGRRMKDEGASDSSFILHPSSLFFAGQIIGVEGYLGNAATGLLAGVNAARLGQDEPLLVLPPTTMIGALCHYVCNAEPKTFQPMKANFGILPRLLKVPRDKRARSALYAKRAQSDLDAYLEQHWQCVQGEEVAVHVLE